MVKKRGRKNFGEELKIIENYAELSGDFFKFLKEKMSNGTDQEKWEAVKMLKGAFEKMIPQDVTSGGEALNIQFDGAFKRKICQNT